MPNQTPAGMPGFNGFFSRNDGFPSLPGAMEEMLFRSMQVARGDPAGDSVRQMLNPTPQRTAEDLQREYNNKYNKPRRMATPAEIAAYQKWYNGNNGQIR
jgi:hypothetical protein